MRDDHDSTLTGAAFAVSSKEHIEVLAAIAFLASAFPLMSQPSVSANEFPPEEATVASVHAALTAGRLTCVRLVECYLRADRRVR